MPLKGSAPKHGHIVMCDFRGFVVPEMVKRRPVVVISHKETHARKLCTVVPISTTAPEKHLDHHCQLSESPFPENFGYQTCWVKCDMLYTVSFDRLDKLHRKTRRGRDYFMPKVSEDDWSSIVSGVQAYLRFLR